MNWDAFSAIGTTAGALITAITVVIAYKQYRLSVSAKLKINVKIVEKTICKNIPQEFITIDFINCGVIDIYIKEIYIKENGIYYNIRDFFSIDSDSGQTNYPVTVTNKCLVSLEVSKGIIKHFVQNTIGYNLENGIKLKFVIVDGKGKAYKKIIPV